MSEIKVIKEDSTKVLTYEEIVEAVRHTFENADARAIWNHIAVQVNVTGEGAGAFYIEVADRFVSVEPYDYYDRDGLITVPGTTIMAIAKHETTIEEEMQKGSLRYDGDAEKLKDLMSIKLPPCKKARASKAKAKSENKNKK